jgi:SAM-dependent methyltransferase
VTRAPRLGAACPVCGAGALTDVIEIPRVPVHCNLLWPTREEALAAPTADIRLAFCGACGHTFNLAFDPELMAYSQRYENSLHFSPRFQEYARSLAADLIERYDLHGKDIIEIGCGKGEFLSLLCELGENRGVGFDPSYVPGEAGAGSPPGMEVIRDFYSERYADRQADLICCRHVLEHLADPRGFLQMVRRVIGGRNTVVVFEVPNGRCTLRDLAIWDIIYEHCSYFSSDSLAQLFRASGFGVRDLSEAFGGQYLCLEAVPGQAVTSGRIPRSELQGMLQEADAFADQYRRKVVQWHKLLKGIMQAGRRAVVWGAGSKGATFSYVLELGGRIDYLIDINPRKSGMYVAGTGQRIVQPEFLREYRADAVIVMNSVYRDEIRERTRDMGLNCEILCA